MTTFEDAKRCPKCGQPGEDRKTHSVLNSRDQPVEVHMIYCVTTLCPWFETPWPVQVNTDGSIPEPYSQIGDKKYPKLSQESVSKIEDNIRRQLQAEVNPNAGEVRNPHG